MADLQDRMSKLILDRESNMELEEVEIDLEKPKRKIKIFSLLSGKLKNSLVSLLNK